MSPLTKKRQTDISETYARGLVADSIEKSATTHGEYSAGFLDALRARDDYESDSGMIDRRDDGEGPDRVTGLVEVWGDGWRIHLARRDRYSDSVDGTAESRDES